MGIDKVKGFLLRNAAVRGIARWRSAAKYYVAECRRFLHYGLPSAEKAGKYGYTLMLACHSLEKGLCHEHPRFFGDKKALAIAEILACHGDGLTPFEMDLGQEILAAWLSFCERDGFTREPAYSKVNDLCDAKGMARVVRRGGAGCLAYSGKGAESSPELFDRAILSRKSLRRFAGGGIDDEAFKACARHFIAAPSACNRQMCRLYWVKRVSGREVIMRVCAAGLTGFDLERASIFIVTFDLASFTCAEEANQGYLNAGLAAMNFVNALHVRGVGSSFVQWVVKERDSSELRASCNIPENETIAVIVAAGPYPDSALIPASKRRPLHDVVRIVEDDGAA